MGIHQGGVLSPPKYSWSLDPLLVYLQEMAMEEGLGVDLSQIRNSDGTWGSFTGSYEVDSPHGRIIFYIQGGRLVAIA